MSKKLDAIVIRDERGNITEEIVRLHKRIARLPSKDRLRWMWVLSSNLHKAMEDFEDDLLTEETVKFKYQKAMNRDQA